MSTDKQDSLRQEVAFITNEHEYDDAERLLLALIDREKRAAVEEAWNQLFDWWKQDIDDESHKDTQWQAVDKAREIKHSMFPPQP